jgi:putative membrane protein
MSIEKQNEGDKLRKSGRTFNTKSEPGVDKVETRQGKAFIPEPDEILNEVPESITAGEVLPHVSEYSGLPLEALPLKGLKSFLYGVAAILVVLVGWEIFSVFKRALEIHWIIATTFVIFYWRTNRHGQSV